MDTLYLLISAKYLDVHFQNCDEPTETFRGTIIAYEETENDIMVMFDENNNFKEYKIPKTLFIGIDNFEDVVDKTCTITGRCGQVEELKFE